MEAERPHAVVSKLQEITEESREYQLKLLDMETQLRRLAALRKIYKEKVPTIPIIDVPKYSPSEVLKQRPSLSYSYNMRKALAIGDKEIRKEIAAKIEALMDQIKPLEKQKSALRSTIREKNKNFYGTNIRPDPKNHEAEIGELNDQITELDEKIESIRKEIAALHSN